MTKYNNNRFTPGNKGNLRAFINRVLIREYYRAFNINQTFDNINNADDITQDSLCQCAPPQANSIKQGWNDPSQSENIRIANALTRTLGGRITYGNYYNPVPINYLGGWEGQPGGLPRPLRNKF